MKIAVPILGFAQSGGYRVLSELASAWTKSNHQVVFFSPQHSPAPYFPTSAETLWLNDQGKPSPRLDSIRAGVDGVARNVRSLLRGLNRNAADFDIILANHSLTAWPVAVSRSRAKRFYYIQAYEPEYFAERSGPSARVLELAALASYWLPLERITNSDIYLSYKLLRAKSWVPPGIDRQLFFPRAAWLPKPGAPFVIGCIGRSEPAKGIRFVLEAYEALRAAGHDVRLRVAFGNIPQEKARLPGCEVVVPRGDGELAEFYRSVDVLVAPGTVQLGAPHYPVMEAMACGTPVITTGYLPASEANSFLVPIEDSQAIAARVLQVMREPQLAEARRTQALIDIAPFTWSSVAAKMLALFEGAPTGPARGACALDSVLR